MQNQINLKRKGRECNIRLIWIEVKRGVKNKTQKSKKGYWERKKKWMEKRVADAEKATENEIKELHIITMVGVEKKSVW